MSRLRRERQAPARAEREVLYDARAEYVKMQIKRKLEEHPGLIDKVDPGWERERGSRLRMTAMALGVSIHLRS